jgi:putative oxidoreductase
MTSQSLSVPASSGVSLLSRLLTTDARVAPALLRTLLAAVMWPHGAQKALGWFGGYGWSGTMGYLTGPIGLPAAFAAVLILLEFLGPLLLLAGAGTRAIAAGLLAIMLGAIATVHGAHGFFMNWFGAQKGEGYEYHLLVIGIALSLVLTGSGRWSLDRLWHARRA